MSLFSRDLLVAWVVAVVLIGAMSAIATISRMLPPDPVPRGSVGIVPTGYFNARVSAKSIELDMPLDDELVTTEIPAILDGDPKAELQEAAAPPLAQPAERKKIPQHC